MPHVSNSYTHGTTKCTVHADRNTFLNVNKNDNYTYDKTLVGNWVEERHDFAISAPIGGTTRPDAPRLTSTQQVHGPFVTNDTQTRLMATRTTAAQTWKTDQVGARQRILPDNAKQMWTGTSQQALSTPPQDLRLFGSSGRMQRAKVSAYTLGTTMGLQQRQMRSWNRHNLNYECQANVGNPNPSQQGAPGGTQFNPYQTSQKSSYSNHEVMPQSSFGRHTGEISGGY